ncbi:hypothetical protein CYANOKiyG1_19200 [Okeania sp. KiyG1]|nr:hypothetical protein CYANOKiyG1_19200 [Okeania sp. KiyG1]
MVKLGGVNLPLAPPLPTHPNPDRGGGEIRSQPTPNPDRGGEKEEETPSRRRKFFGRVKVTEFYRALIRTWYHTSNY